jgi:hypothetical protein
MDIDGLLWDLGQDAQTRDLREELDKLRVQNDMAQWDQCKVKELAEENLELKLRLGLLVRLLISKGIITAPEYAAMIADTRPNTAAGSQVKPTRT